MYQKWAVWILCTLLFSGCGRPFERKHQLEIQPEGLPEQIYTAPETRALQYARVGILPFDTPSENAPLGLKAARFLSQALLEKKVFTEIEVAVDQAPPSRNRWRSLARERNYNLILLGEINSLMDGSQYETARLEITLRAVEIAKSKEITRWYATAIEAIEPKSGFDLVFVKARSAPAPSMDIILRRNLSKFANLFLEARGAYELQ